MSLFDDTVAAYEEWRNEKAARTATENDPDGIARAGLMDLELGLTKLIVLRQIILAMGGFNSGNVPSEVEAHYKGLRAALFDLIQGLAAVDPEFQIEVPNHMGFPDSPAIVQSNLEPDKWLEAKGPRGQSSYAGGLQGLGSAGLGLVFLAPLAVPAWAVGAFVASAGVALVAAVIFAGLSAHQYFVSREGMEAQKTLQIQALAVDKLNAALIECNRTPGCDPAVLLAAMKEQGKIIPPPPTKPGLELGAVLGMGAVAVVVGMVIFREPLLTFFKSRTEERGQRQLPAVAGLSGPRRAHRRSRKSQKRGRA